MQTRPHGGKIRQWSAALWCAVLALVPLVVVAPATSPAAAAAVAPAAGMFVPLPVPARLVDSDGGIGLPSAGDLTAKATVTSKLVGRGGIEAGAVAVAAHVAVGSPTASGSVRAWAAGEPMPGVSTLQFRAGLPWHGSPAMIRLNGAGEASFWNNSDGTLRLVVFVTGFYVDRARADGLRYVPLPQARIVDTRVTTGPTRGAPLGADGQTTFRAAGLGGLPAAGSIGAVTVNVTAIEQQARGAWRLYPAGTEPQLAQGYFEPGRNVTKASIVKLSPDGDLTLQNVSTGTAHYLVEVTGYYPAASAAAATTRVLPVVPQRVVDTANGVGVPKGPLAAGKTVTLQLGGNGGIPGSGVSAVALVFTAYSGSARGVLVTHPPGTDLPEASDVQYPPTLASENVVWARVSPAGAVLLYNGGGEVHVWADVVAYAATPTVPDRPAGVVAAAGDSMAEVTWTAPYDGGAQITRYTVTANPGGHTASSTTTSARVSGLTNGTSYTFTVTATNAVGTSPASAPSAPAVPTDPSPPGQVFVTQVYPRDGEVRVAWTAPTTGGDGVTGFTVRATPGGHTLDAGPDTREATLDGLANGAAYAITVTARNGNGEGPPSPPSEPVVPEPADVPQPPLSPAAFALGGRIEVQWAPPLDGGAPITGYTVRAEPGGHSLTTPPDTTVAAIEGLSNGTAYRVSVNAVNKAGAGEAAVVDGVTPAASRVPAAPGDVQAAPAATGSVELSWRAPGDTGTSAVTAYTITTDPPTTTTTTTATNVTIAGLDPATEYRFTVNARNASGTGPASQPTPLVKPVVALVREPVVLSAASLASLATVRTDGKLIFTAPPSQVRSLTPGAVVIADSTANAPDGLLRKVTRVESSGDTFVVYTEQGALNDVFGQGGFSVTDELDTADGDAPVAAYPGVVASEPIVDGKTYRERATTDDGLPIRPAPVTLNIPVMRVGKSLGGQVSGSLTLHARATLDYDWNGGDVRNESQLNLMTDLKGNFKVGAAKEWTGQKHKIFDKVLAKKTIKIRGIPVKVSLVVAVYAQVRIDGSVGFTGEIGYQHRVDVTMLHADGGWTFPYISQEKGKTSVKSPKFYGELNMKFGAPVRLEVKIYDAVGAGLDVYPNIGVVSNSLDTPWWRIEGGYVASVYAGLPFLRGAEVSRELYNIAFPISQTQDPFVGIRIDPTYAEAVPSEPVDLSVVIDYPDQGIPITWSLVKGSVGAVDSSGNFVSPTEGTAVVRAVSPAANGRPEFEARALIEVGTRVRPPANVVLVGAPGAVLLSWDHATDGPRPETYLITTDPETAPTVVTYPDDHVYLPGLTPGQDYTATIQAFRAGYFSPPVTTGPAAPQSPLLDPNSESNIAIGPDGKVDPYAADGVVLSGNGRYAFFATWAGSLLMPREAYDDESGLYYLLRRDLFTGEIVIASRGADGRTAVPISLVHGVVLDNLPWSSSWDGEVVAFPALVGEGTRTGFLFVHDIAARQTWDASAGVAVTDVSAPKLSFDGDTVAFHTNSEGAPDGQRRRLWRKVKGVPAQEIFTCPAQFTTCYTQHNGFGMSADGRRIAFSVTGHTATSAGGVPVLWDAGTYTTLMPGVEPGESVYNITISADGSTVAAEYRRFSGDTILGLAVKRIGTGRIGPADLVTSTRESDIAFMPLDMSEDGQVIAYTRTMPGARVGYYIDRTERVPHEIAFGVHPFVSISDDAGILAWPQRCATPGRPCTSGETGVWVRML